MNEADERLTAALRETIPFAGVLDIEVLPSEGDEVRARMRWRDDLCTAGGVLHGGALMAFADTVGATCAFAKLPDGSAGTTTIESKTNFLRAVTGDYVECVSRPLHAGRRFIVVESDLFDAAGKRVARVTQTQAVL